MRVDILSRGQMLIGIAVIVAVVAVLLFFVVRPLLNYVIDSKGLRKYPGLNCVCGITNLGFIYEACRGGRTLKMHEMHKKHPVIRLGPNSLSFRDLRAVKDIYGHSTPCTKDDLYNVVQGSAPHILDVVEKPEHARKRRLVSNAYASRNVETWEYKVADKVIRLVQRFDEFCENDQVVDFRRWTNLFTVEAIADIGLSHKMGFLESGDDVVPVRKEDGSIHEYHFVQSLHGGNAAGSRLAWETVWFSIVVKAAKFFSPWIKQQLEHGGHYGDVIGFLLRERLKKQQRGKKMDDFFQALVEDRNGEDRNLESKEIEAEVSVMMNAGSDTTAIQLTNVMYQLLKNPSKLAQLREEIDAAVAANEFDHDFVPYSRVKNLPYLRACLDEALRITPPVSFGLPRRTPAEGAIIADNWVPGSVTVCIPAYVAHRDETLFPEPEQYTPERWLDANAAKLQSCFIAFSAGARGCIGRNISYLEQYVLIATLVRRYEFSFLQDDFQLERKEDFNLLPGALPLRIRRRKISS